MAPNLTLSVPTRAPAATGDGAIISHLTALEGRRVAVLKNAWPSWHDMADRLGELLSDRAGTGSTCDFQVPNGSAAEPTLLESIAATSDGAVVGLANCGSCTAWSYHDAMELARLGTPVVLVVTKEFVGLAEAIGKAKSSPLPMVVLDSNPETIDRAEAIDMLDAAYDRIVAALTQPAPVAAAVAGDTARTFDIDGYDAAQEAFYERGWTDGLPVVLPTAPRLQRMLSGLHGGKALDTVIAEIPPSGFGVTYETLAVNAVMAGCEPGYLPLLAAAVEAICDPAFNLNGIATTTGPSTPMIVVNGPGAALLGLNSGRGALGHGTRANATIGRALRLIINNVGGARPGEVSKSIHGQPARFTFCFAEAESASPWQGLHVDRGLSDVDSAVTVFGVTGTMNLLTPRQDVDAMLTLWADGLAFMGNPNVAMGKGTVSVLISPGHARALSSAGMDKTDVAREIWSRAGIPIERFPQTAHPDASYCFVEQDGLVYPVAGPDNIAVIVVGGPEPTHSTLVPGHPSSVPVTRVFHPTEV